MIDGQHLLFRPARFTFSVGSVAEAKAQDCFHRFPFIRWYREVGNVIAASQGS